MEITVLGIVVNIPDNSPLLINHTDPTKVDKEPIREEQKRLNGSKQFKRKLRAMGKLNHSQLTAKDTQIKSQKDAEIQAELNKNLTISETLKDTTFEKDMARDNVERNKIHREGG